MARAMLMQGIFNTAQVAFLAILFGTAAGILIGVIMCYGNKYIRFPFRLYIDIVRGVPLLVTIFLVFYIVGFLIKAWTGINISQTVSGVIALAALSSAQIAELTRGSIESLHKGQTEAGLAIGLKFRQVFVYVIFPQAVVQIIPPWINTATEMIKGSTLLSLIGLPELLLVGQRIVALRGNALVYYMFIGVIFFSLNTLIQYAGKLMEKKVSFQKTGDR